MDSSRDWKYQERRKFPRAKCPCRVVVDYSLKPIFVHTANLSQGGLRAVLPEQLPEKVNVDIELIFDDKKTIKGTAKVTWVKPRPVSPDTGDLIYDTGFKFVSIAEEDQRYIEGMIKKIIGGV
jgi:hypothetical protein